MKKLLGTFVFLLFVACNDHSLTNEYARPCPVSYKVVSKAPALNQKNIVFTIDSLGKRLLFSITIDPLKLNYPINKAYQDTLSKTALIFDFYNEGKLIQSDYSQLQNTFSWQRDSISKKDLSVVSDTMDLKQGISFNFELPMYVFHQLKKGKQTIELKIHQTVFVDDLYVSRKDSSDKHMYFSELRQMLYAVIRFDLNVPPLYKTMVYGNGLELKNDSSFSPVGMDNTIWNSSYPDIYWSVFYPVDHPYCQTPYETSTDKYVAHDTFLLYHYYVNDSMGIGVYDHDNLSRDDGLGYWTGSFYSPKGESFRRISFDAIKSFDFKIKHLGLCN